MDLYYSTKAYAKINKNMIELKALEDFKHELMENDAFSEIVLY